MSTNLSFTAADYAAYMEDCPLPSSAEMRAFWAAEVEWRPPLLPLRAPRAPSAGASASAPIVVNDDDDDKWTSLRAHMPNASGTYYPYSAKPGGANSKGKKVHVLVDGASDQAFEQTTLGWFEKNKDVATLQRMARRAGVPFHTSTVKSKLARAIMEREALIRPAPSASGARG